ncbi:sensor histidine kinase [Campylobacter suis]|nr:HAMP domain-containing sensor histidine kinase [Campylobacter suis]
MILLICALVYKDTKRLKEKILNYEEHMDKNGFFFDENAEISTSLDELFLQIKEKNKKLTKKSAKIKLRNSQLQGLLGSISHEFKNPIAVINAASQTIKNDPQMDEKTRANFIEKIVRNSQNIVALIDRVNLRSSENLIAQKSKFDLGILVKNIQNELSSRYMDRQILYTQKSVMITADETLMRQVIINLVENALKYSLDEVVIRLNENSLLVCDKGVGIEAKEIKLITKKYFKTSDNNKTNSFGLGLYIVKQILKMHDFELIINSQKDKGSEFGFKFL